MAAMGASPPLADVLTRRAERSSWALAVGLVVGVVALGLLLRAIDPARVAWARNFLLIFSSLLIEAVPFVVLGALVSAIIEVFVPPRVFERLVRLPRAVQVPVAGMAGLAFPVCECGSVPVARRLAARGFAPSAAVTFMLAAPIVNPVVLVSTFVAYRGRDVLWTMVVGRAALGMLVAVVAGWVMGGAWGRQILRGRSPRDSEAPAEDPHEGSRWASFFGHLADDFLFMGRYLILGVAFAAAFQTFLPASFVEGVATVPVLNVAAMMLLAFVLSLCSESDAFIAASFVQFGPAAQLAFLVFGPVVDMKLVMLYRGTYRRGFVLRVVAAVAATTLASTLVLGIFAG